MLLIRTHLSDLTKDFQRKKIDCIVSRVSIGSTICKAVVLSSAHARVVVAIAVSLPLTESGIVVDDERLASSA